MSQIDYDLEDDLETMELFDKGSTKPEKRKLTVTVGQVNMNSGFSLEGLANILQELVATCEKEAYTKPFVRINKYDMGDIGRSGLSLIIEAKRLETDEEYQERLNRIEQAKIKKREFDLKKFYELKKELGL